MSYDFSIRHLQRNIGIHHLMCACLLPTRPNSRIKYFILNYIFGEEAINIFF